MVTVVIGDAEGVCMRERRGERERIFGGMCALSKAAVHITEE